MEFLEFVAEDESEAEAFTTGQGHHLKENNPPLMEQGQGLELLPSRLETLIEEAQPCTSDDTTDQGTPLAVTPSVPGQTPGVLPTDITDHWASDFIAPLIKANLMTLEEPGQFKPHHLLTREAYALMVAKAFNLPKQIAQKRDLLI
ncbi:MAG: S-layer homology domain-containing protein [Synechococcaceae cyanobacterium RL_1_2]|nr:S-layer homology domain-containing protein [Synechococcaceae cyanobacterium RL_1_2]